MAETEKYYISYNNVHRLCQNVAKKIISRNERPDIIIGISGGGLIPARIIRSFLKQKGGKNIPIQAIGLSLYESMGSTSGGVETIGKEIIRTQWLDFGALKEHFDSLIGKKVLVVDEVDDTRTTLHYAISELQKEVEQQQQLLNRSNEPTIFSVFVIHNKDKPKNADLPTELLESGRYFAAETVPDEWLVYPWDADDIDEHTRLAKLQGHD